MSHTTKESDKMLPKDQVGSPSIDEGSLGGSMAGGGGTGLKKGPWTSAEDAILVEYVKKHGEGNWNAVQKHSGLSRCGKSCRLRWANHLRPNLKKGAFTQEEENIIVELHARMGNKWARMAAHLPGRTDNEIKNYWNTRIKRRQRAGLPIYPPNVSFPVSDDNQQGQTVGDFSNIDKIQNDALRGNAFDIPDIIFDDFKVSYTPSFPDISFSNMLSQGFGSSSYGFIGQSLDSKWLQGNETYFPMCPTSIGTELPAFENFSDDPSGKINLTLGTSYPYNSDRLSKNIASYEGVFPGSHALMNGNYSTSSSLPGSIRPELPSFQYPEADQSFWFAYDSSPLSEAVDTIQSPQTVSMQSECSSHHNSGLLEEVIHQSHTMHYGKKLSSDKSPNSSVITPSELVDSSGNNFCEGTLWVDGDPNSPLGYSAASVFNECTPPFSGNSLDELPPSIGTSGLDIMLPSAEDVLASNILERDIKPKPDFSRPDALLGSAWLLESSQMARERTDMNNAIATLLGDDCCNKHRSMPTETSLTFNGAETSLTFNGAETSSTFNGAETSLTFNGAETSSTFNGAQGLDSYAWYNMPCARQMSEHP